jgi:hypothetical protein
VIGGTRKSRIWRRASQGAEPTAPPPGEHSGAAGTWSRRSMAGGLYAVRDALGSALRGRREVTTLGARTLGVASAQRHQQQHIPHIRLRQSSPRLHHPTYLDLHRTTHRTEVIMAMDTDTIPNLLGEARDQAPEELQEYFIAFEDYWERKLWHELTDKLVEFYDLPGSAKLRIPFFETFIKSFANKINQLKLVTLGLNTASQYKGRSGSVTIKDAH